NDLIKLLKKYEMDIKSHAKMKSDIVTLSRSLTTLAHISSVPENRGFFIKYPLQEIIKAANTSIEAAKCLNGKNQLASKRRELWNDAYNRYKILIAGTETTDGFETKLTEVYQYLGHKS